MQMRLSVMETLVSRGGLLGRLDHSTGIRRRCGGDCVGIGKCLRWLGTTVVCFRKRYPGRIPQCRTIRFPELYHPTLSNDETVGRGWGTRRWWSEKQKQFPPLRCGMTNKKG